MEQKRSPKYILLSQLTNKQVETNTSTLPYLSVLDQTSATARLPLTSRSNNNKGLANNFKPLEEELKSIFKIYVIQQQKKKTLLKLNKLLQKQIKQKTGISQIQILNELEKQKKQQKNIELEIQKIKKNYNQQIAIIQQLKQQIATCRSQRIVYSRLFQKIQKQIKTRQKLYQRLILQSQNQKQITIQQFVQTKKEVKIHSEQDIVDQVLPWVMQSYGFDLGNFFVTLPDRTIKIKQRDSYKPRPRRQTQVNPIPKIVGVLQYFVGKITRDAQCLSVQQAEIKYKDIQKVNNEFIEKIQEKDREIQQLQSSIQNMKNCTKSSLKNIEQNQILKEASMKNNQILQKICYLFGLTKENNRQAQIIQKVNRLICLPAYDLANQPLDVVLSKIKRDDDNQKFLRKQQLQTQGLRDIFQLKYKNKQKKLTFNYINSKKLQPLNL